LTVPEHIRQVLQSATPLVAKADLEQRLVTGWASVIEEDGVAVIDRQGDVIDEAELVTAAAGFMRDHRHLGHQHQQTEGIGEVVESFVLTRAAKAALGLPPGTPTGWLITAHVRDEMTWNRVKAGELPMFSIGGSAIREIVKTGSKTGFLCFSLTGGSVALYDNAP
jgi:hypothetical protein